MNASPPESASAPEPAGRSLPARRRRRIVVGIVSVFGMVAILLGAVLLFLTSDSGRRFVAERIAALEFDSGLKIGIGRIDGSLFGRMVLRRVTLADDKGVFLTSPEIAVDWRPLAYFGNHLDLRRVASPRMLLSRKPDLRPSAPDQPLLPDIDIDVGRLTIGQLVAGPALTGKQRVLRIDGSAHIADRRAQIALRADTLPESGGHGDGQAGDRLKLELDAVPQANRLSFNLQVDAPPQGVIAGLTGLDKALIVRAGGHGDWRHWNGTIAADLAGQPLARLGLTARSGTFGLTGTARLARLANWPPGSILGSPATMALRTGWQDRRARLAGRIGADGATLDLDGTVDLGRNRFDNLRLRLLLADARPIAPNLAGRGILLLSTLDGDIARPSVDYRLTAGALVLGDVTIEGLAAQGLAHVGQDHTIVPVSARAARITGLDSLAGGTIAQVRIDGDLAVDWPRILSDNLRIRSDRIDATAIAIADTARGLYSGAFAGKIANYRVRSVGIFNLDTSADLKSLADGGFALTGKVRAQSTRISSPGARQLLDGNVLVSSDLAYGPDGVIRFSRLRLASPQMRIVDGAGSYRANGTIALRANGASRAYGPVGVELAGNIAAPRAIITAARPGLGVGLAALRAEVHAAGSAYRISATGTTEYGPVTAQLRVLAQPVLAIDVERASIAGIGLSGALRRSSAGPFTGLLAARGAGLDGEVRLAATGRYQQLLVHLRANNAVLPPPAKIAVGRALIDADIVLYQRPQISADIQLAQARIGGFDLAVFRGQANYRDGSGSAQFLAEGVRGVPFRIAANSELRPDRWRVALKGRINGVDVATAAPAVILPRGARYELLPSELTVERGRLQLAGSFGRDLRLQSRFEALDLALFDALAPGLGLGGKANGRLDYTGGGSQLPLIDAQLSIRNFTRTTAISSSKPMDVNLIARTAPGSGDLRAVMRMGNTVVGRVQASVQPRGGGGWRERFAQGALRGGIRYSGPADGLFALAALPDQQLRGPVVLGADFSCTLERPCLNGVLRGRDMAYENTTYGTSLTGMTVAGRFTGDRLEIDQLNARAGSGTVSGRGTISLAAASGYPANIELTLDNARIADSDALSATASGAVQLVKLPNRMPVLTGTVRLPQTHYELIRQGSSRVPELAGVRFKPPRGLQRVSGDAAAPGPGISAIALDLRIVTAGRLHVTGMGLDSDWSADFRVTGTTDAPRMTGTAELRRGSIDFASRSFDLSQGRVIFAGGPASEARVDLRGQERVDDIDVLLNISGSATVPQIAFSSTPALPQDEVLSRLLFGSAIGNLSAIEGLQLAASLNALRQTGGGLNPLGRLQAATGFDRLRVLAADETRGRGTALEVGKHIGDAIYLQVVTDARGFTATQLEIALSRSLSILSQAGGGNTANVDLRFRKSY